MLRQTGSGVISRRSSFQRFDFGVLTSASDAMTGDK
jgi:hypothetical protein